MEHKSLLARVTPSVLLTIPIMILAPHAARLLPGDPLLVALQFTRYFQLLHLCLARVDELQKDSLHLSINHSQKLPPTTLPDAQLH